ncbi:putative proteasome subunit alpha type-5 [Apostichopus japonicus]|uniref:Putative proteasome subunit alpha type-5 n=1 Tax=Stichopus japonicus TaxID=307972 RepID=A0A2G8KBD7_STIJA|nr:putative proteasome subunit alpha type-5 [Apostichopus japonicus]
MTARLHSDRNQNFRRGGFSSRETSHFSLMESKSVEKIVEIDCHLGCAMSGLIADSRTLVDKARVEAQSHWFTYNEKMSVESVTQAVSNLALQFGDDDAGMVPWSSRPFGVALLVGGIDEKGPQLFHMDPSGTFIEFEAKAIGSGSEGAQSHLQEVYHKSMTLNEALKEALVVLKQIMEEKLNATNVEFDQVVREVNCCHVTRDKNFHMFSKQEIEDIITKM